MEVLAGFLIADFSG